MVVIHKFEACRRCPGATEWRLMHGYLLCERCQRRKYPPRRHPARRILALAILSGLVAAGAAWGIFVFGPRA